MKRVLSAILTFIMIKAINRSLFEVLFFNKTENKESADIGDKIVHTASEEDAAFILENSSKIIDF